MKAKNIAEVVSDEEKLVGGDWIDRVRQQAKLGMDYRTLSGASVGYISPPTSEPLPDWDVAFLRLKEEKFLVHPHKSVREKEEARMGKFQWRLVLSAPKAEYAGDKEKYQG